MKHAICIMAALVLASCGGEKPNTPAPSGPHGGPPPPSLSQPWRPDSDQSAEAMYLRKCGVCHGPGGTGWLQLAKRTGPQKASLTDRDDLDPAMVTAVVRSGMGGMPAFTRVEVSDRELQQIGEFLAQKEAAQ